MTSDNAHRLTASLPPHIAAFVNEYQKRTGTSKSDIVVQGIRALQEKLLAEEYAEYARSSEFTDLEDGEGLDDEAERWQ